MVQKMLCPLMEVHRSVQDQRTVVARIIKFCNLRQHLINNPYLCNGLLLLITLCTNEIEQHID
jgi:hypothetical protein